MKANAAKIQFDRSSKGRFVPMLVATAAALLLLASTACSPAALEAKRVADQCNATHGFSTPKSVACMSTGHDRIAMASESGANDL